MHTLLFLVSIVTISNNFRMRRNVLLTSATGMPPKWTPLSQPRKLE